jgi:glutamate synthase (NADPH/NADH) small chain
MGKPTGFKEVSRQVPTRRPVELRILDWEEIYAEFPEDQLKRQGSRCMDCGVPFCNNGCPLGNLIPDWADLVYRGRHREALDALLKTNNFPEFTGRICPAPCEESCVLSINDKAVTIKVLEQAIVDRAFKEGWIKPEPPPRRTGKRVAVVGSGPAGLAAAAQLNKVGHTVTVFEKADRPGGLLIYGIPDFKMSKAVVARRVKLMEDEGITFVCHADVGVTITADQLRTDFDAVVLCNGATRARDIDVPGRNLHGIHLAMTYLPQPTKKNLSEQELTGANGHNARNGGSRYGGAEIGGGTVGDQIFQQQHIHADGKHVVIVGAGDTAADCLGSAIRQHAKSINQLNIYPKPPSARTDDMPWPQYPHIHRTSAAHEEGGVRQWAVQTKAFHGDEHGHVKEVVLVRQEVAETRDGKQVMREIPGSEFTLPCDLALIAIGFTGPDPEGIISQLGCELDRRGNVKVDASYMTSVPAVFSAGDARRGQSLVVWAISEGRSAAHAVDKYLMGQSDLPFLKLF